MAGKSNRPRAFVTSLLIREISTGHIGAIYVSFIENAFFSERRWNLLSDTERRHLIGLARIANAYYDPFEFIPPK